MPWAPLIHSCDGYVFVDWRTSWHPSVDVYQDDWMIELARERFRHPFMCIGVRGDKGQVAALIGKPCIMFDDKEDNIDLLRERSTDMVPLHGLVVRRGRKHSRRVSEGFSRTTDCRLWPEFVLRFLDLVRARNSEAEVRNHLATAAMTSSIATSHSRSRSAPDLD